MAKVPVVTKRPQGEHPFPEYWNVLREQVLKEQNNSCATCSNSGSDYTLDLHHRHYNNFGNENRNDVLILCRLCHEAITSSIRSRRFQDSKLTSSVTEAIQPIGIISYEKPKL